MKQTQLNIPNQAVNLLESESEEFETILDYLMYEKSLVTFGDGKRVDHCIDLARSLSTGDHIFAKNNFDTMISIVFELVLTKKIDPWNIDLIAFARDYLIQVKKNNYLDLFIIGKMLFMAWGILKKKTDIMVEEAQKANEESIVEDLPEMVDFDLEGPHFDTFFGDDGVEDFTPIISEVPLRDSKRSATLLDVLDALVDAAAEAKRYKIIEERRRLLRSQRKSSDEIKKEINDNFHTDNLEHDKEIVWERIGKFNRQPIPFDNICNWGDRRDVISTLISSAHLAQELKINLWQNNFPYGDIYVKNLILKHSN